MQLLFSSSSFSPVLTYLPTYSGDTYTANLTKTPTTYRNTCRVRFTEHEIAKLWYKSLLTYVPPVHLKLGRFLRPNTIDVAEVIRLQRGK
ncbi:hypothetical protein F4810DRAFT_665290 [Camillea tinctor]|nr:hypothetical protein F4810DRAFT_665290 [Camillea tinctor]